MTCSVPAIFGLKQWHDHHFGDLCTQHDVAYRHCAIPKTQADFAFCSGVCARGYPALAILYLFLLATFGWLFWLNNRIKRG